MAIYINSASSVNSWIPLGQESITETPPVFEGNRIACIDPDYKTYIPDAGIRRRMNRAVKLGFAAAMQCVQKAGMPQLDAIITATGLGCLADTEKFLNSIVDTNEQLLNPTPFTQSTFNTLGSQIAIALNNTCYNVTYVHRGFSLESALTDARLLLETNEAQQVLVGAVDETTDNSFFILNRLGFWKENLATTTELYNSTSRGTISGEGSQFFVLSNQPTADTKAILTDHLMVFRPDGKEELVNKLSAFLQKNGLNQNDIDLFISGENGDSHDDIYYHTIESALFSQTPIANYKHLTGEYQTVSSFALWLASKLIDTQSIPNYLLKGTEQPNKLNNVLIYNHYKGNDHSFLLLSKA